LVKDSRINGAAKGRFGGVQLEGGVFQAGLLEMEFGLVRIILPLGQLGGVIAVDAGDGVVVAYRTVSPQDGFNQLLTVDGVFQGQPEIVVVVRGVSQRMAKV
jgi:hypothetical protein